MSGPAMESRHIFGHSVAIRTHRLENGLGIILLPDSTAPVVSYQTWYRVGSRHDLRGRTGLAHLLEHLMSTQTTNVPPGDFDRRMELAGGYTNAATSLDWTFYCDNLPASGLELAAGLEADRMKNLILSTEELESERQVVANERRCHVDDDVEGFLGEELYRLAFTSHPYHCPTIGWMDDILAITQEDAQSFYRKFYAPNNATVVLVGDFQPDEALSTISRYYADIAPGACVPESAIAEPPQQGERRARHRKPVSGEKLVIGWRAAAQGHLDWLPLQVLREILTDSASSRLHRRLIIETEAAADHQGSLSPTRDPGLFEICVAMKRGRTAAEAETIIEEEIDLLHRHPASDEDLAKAKNRLETFFWSTLETTPGKAQSLGHFEATVGDHRALFQVAERIASISAEDIERVVATYLKPDHRTVIVAEPSDCPWEEHR